MLIWEVSVSLETEFCLAALEYALQQAKPEIFNSDQGCQFTSLAFTRRLQSGEIAISMDGRGQVYDNIFVERLWRSVKYEKVYLNDWQKVAEASSGLSEYFKLYHHERPHQALGDKSPNSGNMGKHIFPLLFLRRILAQKMFSFQKRLRANGFDHQTFYHRRGRIIIRKSIFKGINWGIAAASHFKVQVRQTVTAFA